MVVGGEGGGIGEDVAERFEYLLSSRRHFFEKQRSWEDELIAGEFSLLPTCVEARTSRLPSVNTRSLRFGAFQYPDMLCELSIGLRTRPQRVLATELEITRVAGPAVKKLARRTAMEYGLKLGYFTSGASDAGWWHYRKKSCLACAVNMVLLCPLRELNWAIAPYTTFSLFLRNICPAFLKNN